MNKAIPELSIDARHLQERLEKLAPGEEITWGALSEVIGRDVRGAAKGPLETARRRAQKESEIVVAAVRGVGLKRLDNAAIVTTGQSIFGTIGRAARRGVKRILCADFAELTNEQRIKHNSYVSGLGAVAHMAKPNQLKKLEGQVETASVKELPLARTLEVFSS